MKVTVANSEDYIKYYARLLDEIKLFELQEDTTNYIIHRVKLGNESQDVSLLNSCLNKILDNQYYNKEYIRIEDIKEINNLIVGLSKEECQVVNAYSELNGKELNSLEKIKNLINDVKHYQIIPAYDLHDLGIMIAEKIPNYHINTELMPYINFSKIAENYLFDAKMDKSFCSYGLLVDTRKIIENELVHSNCYNKIFKLKVVNKQEFEESDEYSEVTIHLPSSQKELEDKFKKINLDYNNLNINDTHVIKCEVFNFDNYLTKEFNQMIGNEIIMWGTDSYFTPFQEIQLLYEEVKKFDNTQMEKFIALTYATEKEKGIEYINELVEIAKNTKKYELLPGVKNYEELGRFLVNDSGHFDEVSFLDAYINYEELAKDYSDVGHIYNGTFTRFGYIMQKEDFEDEEIADADSNNNLEEDEEESY